MIGTSNKDIATIKELIRPYKSFFLIGCGDCATVCKTGGEDQVKQFSGYLEKDGKKVNGWAVLEEACDLRLAKKLFREQESAINKSEAILVFSCGSGVQTVAEITEKKVLPMLDSLFAGGIENLSNFRELCSVCGDCMLDITAGICPVTRCPKGLVNGPCGGSNEGKCEENTELDCAWYLIYSRLKQRDEIGGLRKLRKIKNNRANSKPHKIKLQKK
ncbi:MAG: methylenetetrahydrofolate reductase C-terminal domain-containing protein [bacterium]